MSSSHVPSLIVSLALLSGAAQAATVQGKAPPPLQFGTRTQLRECLDLDDSMKARLRDMQAAAAAHNQKFETIDAEEAQLVEMKARLDRSDKTAISAFNQAVQDHHLHIQQADAEATEADAASRAYASDKADMDQKCGSLTYRPADIQAVAKERSKAASAP